MSVPPSDYDRAYALRHSVAADNWLFDTLLALLAPPPGWRILDVGCNTGELTARLTELQCQTLGIDINTEAIAIARQRFPNLAFKVSEVSMLEEGNFDAIVASHVIEHLAVPVDFLRAAHQRLKSGGRLIVATPNSHAWLRKLTNWIRGAIFFDDPTHRHLFAPSELKGMVRSAGFELVAVITLPLYFPFATRLPPCLRRGIPAFGMGDHLFVVAASGSARRD